MSPEDVRPGDALVRDIYTADSTRDAKDDVALNEHMSGMVRGLGQICRLSETISVTA